MWVRSTEKVWELFMRGQKTMRYMNKKRAVRALLALRGTAKGGLAAEYYDHSSRSDWQQCPEDGIFDLLCDLRHLCDALELDFVSLVSRSDNEYMFECD
jgi:hypothetical protein